MIILAWIILLLAVWDLFTTLMDGYKSKAYYTWKELLIHENMKWILPQFIGDILVVIFIIIYLRG